MGAVVLALLLAIPSNDAEAGPLSRGIDPAGARLALGWDSFLTVEGARTAPAGSYQLFLATDYAAGLVSLRRGDEKIGDLIGRRLDLHLLGSIAVTDWAELGLDVPFTAYQTNGFADLEAATGFSDTPPDGTGAGDVKLLGRVRLASEQHAPVAIAVVAEVRLPTGDERSFLGERGVSIAPRAVVERSFGDLRVGLEGGYRWRSEAGRYLNLYLGDELALALAAAWRLPESWPLGGWTALAEVVTSTPSRAPFTLASADALKTPLEALLGLRGELGSGFHALVGGGTGVAGESGLGRESFRLFAALGHRGLAEPAVDRDSDGDGILDSEDLCPSEPGPRELDGCPDSDGDSIPDVDDECPDEPGPAVNDGCPADDPLVVHEEGKIVLRGAINFDTAKADIKADSFAVLDQVAEMLHDHPEIVRVRIEGHTDSVGSATYNRTLSQRRAASVMRYLIQRGVERSRLEAKGYGPDEPIADNASALGRAKNRRVAFTVLEKR